MASGAAKRYAQAVISLAKERGTLDAWQADLGRLNELMADPGAHAFFTNPNVSLDQQRTVVDQVLAGAQPEARNLGRMLAERHRMQIIPDLYQLYTDARLAELGIAVAEVTTAEPLGAEEQEIVRNQLQKLIGKQIEIRTRVDPSIIGGVVARVGDLLIDGSVINQLRRLRARLTAPAA